MVFKFEEGDEVVLRNGEGHSSFLTAGSRGVIFCQFASDPPAYEVNFRDSMGQEFGSIVYEDDIEMMRDTTVLPWREVVRID
jgi:hypothetical protein